MGAGTGTAARGHAAPVPRCEGIGMIDRLIRRAYRTRSWLLCHLGIHLWALRRNPEVGGKEAMYDQCRRCGRERAEFTPPRPGSTGGMAV